MSSDTDKSRRRREKNVFKQPGGLKHLRRGKACLNCRFLKIKCDGVKPTCGPCIRVPKDDPCEFTDGPSRTVMLQENLARLQARVRELEGDSVSDANSPAPPPYQSHPHSEETTTPATVKTVVSAVCLFAIHLSRDDAPREAEFLRQALYGLPLEMGSSSFEPARIMDIILAKVLLASYFLRKNQFFESDYHISSAVSLCVAYGLHKS
ncbi:hypothetical protein MPER_10976, partial [Moniliophthora perniciosa FA553]